MNSNIWIEYKTWSYEKLKLTAWKIILIDKVIDSEGDTQRDRQTEIDT